MDNYYSSPLLYDTLRQHDTMPCGTVRISRKEMPQALKKKLQPGNIVCRQRDNLLALKWKDKRDVCMLSMLHSDTVSVDRKGQKTKPSAVLSYNDNMGGVDVFDQVAKYYYPIRTTVKWWKKLFLHLFNMCITNSYIMHRKYTDKKKKMGHFDFRNALLKEMIETADEAPTPKAAGRKLHSQGAELRRLHERHFLQTIKPKPGCKKLKPTRQCHVCNVPPSKRSAEDKKKRSESRYECKQCVKTLCVEPCFELFHTKKYFRPNGVNDEYTESDMETIDD